MLQRHSARDRERTQPREIGWQIAKTLAKKMPGSSVCGSLAATAGEPAPPTPHSSPVEIITSCTQRKPAGARSDFEQILLWRLLRKPVQQIEAYPARKEHGQNMNHG